MTVARDSAWIYARRSRKSDDRASVEAQTDRALDEIREHGWQHAGTLSEEISASRFAKKQREAWPLLLEAIRDGRCGIVVLWESNRGDRTLESWARFLELCRQAGTRIYVITHEHLYSLDRARDWETLASEGVKNQSFSNQLSNDVKRGKNAAMRKGRPAGQTPYGYKVRYNPATGRTAGWEIVPDEAGIVREIKRRVGASVPVNTIVLDLDARGIPGPTGGRWNTRSVRHIARNPAYAGLVRLADGTHAERQEQADGAKWPAICARDEHDAAVAVLSARARGPLERPGAAKHLMSNLADCDCGTPVTSRGNGIYACETGHMSVRAWWLDEIVSHSVKEWLRRPEARAAFDVDTGPRTGQLRRDLVQLEARREKWRARAADGDEDADEILAQLRPKITAVKRELDEVMISPAVRELLDADDVDAVWKSLTVQGRRAAIAAVTGVTVRRVPKGATREQRDDISRVQFDWKPQRSRKGPGGRVRAIADVV